MINIHTHSKLGHKYNELEIIASSVEHTYVALRSAGATWRDGLGMYSWYNRGRVFLAKCLTLSEVRQEPSTALSLGQITCTSKFTSLSRDPHPQSLTLPNYIRLPVTQRERPKCLSRTDKRQGARAGLGKWPLLAKICCDCIFHLKRSDRFNWIKQLISLSLRSVCVCMRVCVRMCSSMCVRERMCTCVCVWEWYSSSKLLFKCRGQPKHRSPVKPALCICSCLSPVRAGPRPASALLKSQITAQRK